jgi:hypothetical protein
MNLETPTVRREYARKKLSLQQNLAQENLLQINDAADHAPPDRGDQGLLGSRKKFGKLLEHAALWHRSNNFRLDLTLVEQQHGGNAHDVETTSDIAVVIYVEFRDGDLAWHLSTDLIEDGCNLLARSAPFGPKVNQNRCI